ncbi:hypothetical protein [Crystallibacter degradans]|uniref:hypothetical protein n=1 Tax=Crystallibacter degradans TaxID=2726743 RepID=UPI001473686F|nr:hypothetical protein [Arthrobacter sp. SF27]NMR29482.1 hypothetical protein [Arthrobacter sp. SF27]
MELLSGHAGKRAVAFIGRGMLAGMAGTAVMTAFQKLVEMPLTGRPDSYAPAELAEKFLPVKVESIRGRKLLNNSAHFAIGAMWGAAYGTAAALGLRGQKAINTVFAVVYGGGLLGGSLSGFSRPSEWSAQDWAVDVVDIYVQAQATGLVFVRLLAPKSLPHAGNRGRVNAA